MRKTMLVLIGLALVATLALALPGCGSSASSRTSPQGRTCLANMRTVDSAIEAYNALKDAYPKSMQQMVGAMLKKVPVCPAGGKYVWVDGKPPTIKCTIHGTP